MAITLTRQPASATSNGGDLDNTTTQTIPGAKIFSGSVTASGALATSPTLLTDSQATAMGLKRYLYNVAYNSGITPSITASGTTTGINVQHAWFIPYQIQDGTWRMKINYAGQKGNTSQDYNFTVNGVSTATGVTNGGEQACAGGAIGGGVSLEYSIVDGGVFTVYASASAGFSTIRLYGDVQLSSKPTWAY